MRYARAILSACLTLSAVHLGSACSGSVTVSTEVGPEGGSIEGPNGVRVFIPPGALTERTQITIRTVSEAAAPALAGGLAYDGDVYAFEPHGLSFAQPVQVKLPVANGASAEVVHAPCAQGTTGADSCKAWDQNVEGVTLGGGFASFSTRGFSLYASAVVIGGKGDGGEGGIGNSGGMGGIGNSGGAGGAGGAGNSGGAGGAGNSGGAGGSGGCIHDGFYYVGTSAALADLANICVIKGGLTISASDLTSVALPALEDIQGDLVVMSDVPMELQSLSFPALNHVQNVYLNFYTPKLQTVGFDTLTTIDGDLSASQGVNVMISAPLLQSVGGRVTLYNGMASFDAPSLESVGGIVELYDLWSLNLAKLATVGGFFAINKTHLGVLDLPSLISIGELPSSGNQPLDLDEDAEFGVCSVPHANLQLTDIHAPLLAKLGANNDGNINIGNNPLLPQCRIDALAAQLQAAGWTGHVLNADPTKCKVSSATCP